jgi:hypothetical protein
LDALALVDVFFSMNLILYDILAIVAFVLSSVVSYTVVLVRNSKRDVYHQIPILKAFLYALGWTPVVFICFLLILGFLGGS